MVDPTIDAQCRQHVAPEESTEAVVDLEGACEFGGEASLAWAGRGAGAGTPVPRIPCERSTSLISYTASWPSLYTVLSTVVFTSPVVMFTWVPLLITFRGKSTASLPASVRTGLLTVWNCERAMKVGMIWNCANLTFCLSVNEFRVPVVRSEKALSAGANMVKPWLDAFWSWLLIGSSIWVFFSNPMKVVNFPDFRRTEVTSETREELVWLKVLVQRCNKASRSRNEETWFIIFWRLFRYWELGACCSWKVRRRIGLDEFGGERNNFL